MPNKKERKALKKYKECKPYKDFLIYEYDEDDMNADDKYKKGIAPYGYKPFRAKTKYSKNK